MMKSILSLLPLAALTLSQEHQAPLEDRPIAPIRPLSSDAISLLGFGTWRLTDNTSEAVSWAIQTGYRHIDCAAAYGNEVEVGEGIKDGLRKTGLSRDDLWITSKLWNDHHGDADRVEAAIDESLQKLGLDYLNLYLMHWSVAKDPDTDVNVIEYKHTWAAMEELVDKGKTHHIGVANFSPHEMKKLLKHSKSHPPQVHQMELHPYLQQYEFVKWHQDLGIHVTAYSPFAGTNPIYDPDPSVHDLPTPLLNNSVIKSVADDRDCTPAQVAIMWGLTRGTSVIPKSSHKSYITENFHSLECILEEEDFEKIAELGEEHFRYNNPSKSWGVPLYEGLEDWNGKHKPAEVVDVHEEL